MQSCQTNGISILTIVAPVNKNYSLSEKRVRLFELCFHLLLCPTIEVQ